MRGRSYGILLAGVLLSALPWLVIGRLIARHQALHHQIRLTQTRDQLCLALTAASVELAHDAAPADPRARASEDPLIRALGLRRLPPGPTPPGAGPARSASPESSRGHPDRAAETPGCANPAALAGLHLSNDSAAPGLLRISRSGGPTTTPPLALQLDSGALLEGEGLVQVLEPTATPSAKARAERLQVGGNELLIALPPHGEDGNGLQSQSLALVLAALGLLITGSLALRSEAEGRRQRQRLANLRLDSQSGLLSRLALEEDLDDAAKAGGALPPALLVMGNLRLLQRQAPFRRDGEIQALFTSLSEAIGGIEAIGPEPRCYRASENRLALLLQAPAGDDEALLAELERAIRSALQGWSGASLRSDDLLLTGQRLSPAVGAATQLDLHGYGEILARDAGLSVRMIEVEDRRRVQEEAAIREQLQTLGPTDIQLVFQPILLLASPGQFALEALVRFRPERLRRESTGRLMAIAHALGIAHRIDGLVLRQLPTLLTALRANPSLDRRIASIALNVSGESFATPQRLEQLITTLRDLAIDPARFSLEFTETPSGEQPGESNAVTIASERLTRELKLRIAIDDFGSGLSNYRRICEAWYDSVKLDIGLVAGIGGSFRLQRYVGSLIETVHALGKTVVCEGVENLADFTAAVRLGADAVQGYLIARPMAWEAIPLFLDKAEWGSAERIAAMVAKIHRSDRLLLPDPPSQTAAAAVPLERQILDNWYELRSFEEFLLLFVNELKSWGLDILRLSLAFLPDQDDIDCSQYVWVPARPGEVRSLRMDRAFLQQQEHVSSALHHIATRERFYRQRLATRREVEFSFLDQLREQGCSDYLGLRLDSRGISIPVLTIALRGESSFSDEQIQRIVSMSSLLSLLFYSFESERAKRLALLDPLTALPNRRSFDSFLAANITAARLQRSSLALVLIDVDRFKQVNDSLGHAFGDACLRELAAVLNADLRQNRDFAARLGGEEFALILPQTSAAEARQLGELLREAVTRARVVAGDRRSSLALTISLGIAVWDAAGVADADADGLLQLADDCLYEAKRQGRNRVVCRELRG